MEFKWEQKGNLLTVKTPKDFSYYFIMPNDWKIEDTHKDLFKLAEWVLFSPFYEGFNKQDILNYNWSRKKGNKMGLSWSSGVDSTAAMMLLPEDTVLFYHQRAGIPVTVMNQENAFEAIKNIDREVAIVKSNHELINETHGYFRRGFTTDLACCAGMILLADSLDLGYIATGTMLGSTYLQKGNFYREFGESWYWEHWSHLFRLAGLELNFPVAGCSEILTNEIVNKSPMKGKVFSCLRTKGMCGRCFKCFRKQLINKEPVNLKSREIRRNIAKKPIHQGDSLVYAYQKSNLKIPALEEYKDIETLFLERYYPKSFELISDKFKEIVKNNLEKYGIKPMTEQDEINLKKFKI